MMDIMSWIVVGIFVLFELAVIYLGSFILFEVLGIKFNFSKKRFVLTCMFILLLHWIAI